MKTAGKMVLTLVALLSLAATASAADKLAVKNSGGTATYFNVTDTGVVGINTPVPTVATKLNITEDTTPQTSIKVVENVTVGTTSRFKLQNNGAGFWYLQSGQPTEPDIASLIGYVTPAGYGGIAMIDYRNNQGTTNSRAQMVNYGPTLSFYNQTAFNLPTFNVTYDDKVGISVLAPKQKLEVNGGLRLYPQAVTNSYQVPSVNTPAPTKPTCDANAKGTFWFTPGTTDTIEICMQTSTSLSWKKLALDATTP